jgi:hypothetical protein
METVLRESIERIGAHALPGELGMPHPACLGDAPVRGARGT